MFFNINMKTVIHNDEPTSKDTLDRGKFAKAFADIIESCETPLVIGVYGNWGVGKTSLMQQIKTELHEKSSVKSVWFDPWQHQFDENPALALMHTMIEQLELDSEAKKLLMVIGGALGSIILKATTNLTANEINTLGEKYEEERFLIREKQVCLKRHFEKLIENAKGDKDNRIVFFIDDLDRCLPEQVLVTLEAFKLYLNIVGCVYVIGVDRGALEGSIRHRYKDFNIGEIDYLDKIVQLPFTIPPIDAEKIENFISPLLPKSLSATKDILIRGLGDNPRQVKRFINTLLLNHRLALEILGQDYDPIKLVFILVVQYRQPELFKIATQDPSILTHIANPDDEKKKAARDYYIGDDDRLIQIFDNKVFLSGNELKQYIYLSEVAGVADVTFDVIVESIGEKRAGIIREIIRMQDTGLKEANELLESPPFVLAGRVSRDEAQEIKKRLQSLGATVSLQ